MHNASNPVLRGFAPDPSVIHVDGWFYLANSSFEWFPTVPLYRSRNLTDWVYIGSVEHAAPGQTLRGVPDSAGIWAPALSHDGTQFWITYSIVRTFHGRQLDVETFVATTNDPTDGWNLPRRVSGHGFDPSLFHHDGKHYLLNLQSDSRPGGSRFSGILIVELNADGTATAGTPTLLLQHTELIEGPKLLHHDGWFYLVLAEGGTGTEHGVRVARSRALHDPYTLDAEPLLTSRDNPHLRLQKAGHGELVTDTQGNWFITFLAARWLSTTHGRQFPWGRETCVQSISWSDGWPRLAEGGHHPANTVTVPNSTPDAPPVPANYGRPWYSLRAPADQWAHLTEPTGPIRLRGQHDLESMFDVSLLAKPLTSRSTRFGATVDAAPRSYTDAAGIVAWYNSTSYCSLAITWSEPEQEPQSGQQWAGDGRRVVVLTVRDTDGAHVLAKTELPDQRPAALGVTINGSAIQFDLSDQPIGPPIDVGILSDDYGPLLRFTGAMIGIFAVDTVDAAFIATFQNIHRTDTHGSATAHATA
ncbi:family 43 glycosylhydrolase [Curtobacterium flaccumfaciens]|uniref:family 43 glycosylhydrolase n=1 Tax=Curtobacterium flaccumfaciens TaxID=2035 RepID=UPI001E48CE36|nr:family 43 glycosylhydrolase [Curtobacterium allii]MCE0459463.1 family 43 glycosylhydrolase [Curtobacterium allii]